jgi:signal transduction histidine kinase
MAGFFWSFRGALVVATASSIATALLVYRPEWLGLASYPHEHPLRYVAETVAQIWVTAFLLHFALEFIRQAAADRHRAELATAEARLELERRQRETQKFEAIGRLAAGVAHDFNNLLMVIVGQLDVARRKHPDAVLDGANDAAIRAGRLVNELLAIGRKQELSARPFELNTYLRELEPVLRRVLGSSAELDLAPAPDDYWVVADPHQLERVLINLVANARDATPHGERVRIEASREGTELRLTIEDRGSGMSPEIQARIFEPFFSTKGNAGTGLGLATAEGIVAQSGGRLAVESRVGAGTRMHVFLPASRADN